MSQQPYDFGQSSPDRSETVPESPQYGYEPRRSYSEFAAIQPGSKGHKKRSSFRRIVGTMLLVVGMCLFALPFLHMFGVFHFLGFGPESMTPDYMNGTMSYMTAGFIGFALMTVSVLIRGKGK